MEDPVVKFPETFDGRFYFTNFSNVDYTDHWGGVAYTFPAMTTSPIVIPTATGNETQAIRKKFARGLAEREFYKSDKLKMLEGQTPVGQGQNLHSAATYTESDLTPYIQKCLAPLPISSAKVEKVMKREISISSSTKVLKGKATDDGRIEEADSLVGQGEVVA